MINKTLKHSLTLGALALGVTVMTGCQDYLPDEPVRPYEELGLPTFSMSTDLVFDIDLGLPGVTYPVKVYTENPFDENGDLRSGIQPIYAFFTSDGRYNETVRLSGSYDKLYLACGGIGVPMLMEAIVENGVVRAIASDETRAGNSYENVVTEHKKNELNLGDYEILNVGQVKGDGTHYFERFGDPTSSVNQTFWNSLHSLYTWTSTGKPFRKGSIDTYSVDEIDSSVLELDYSYSWYFDNSDMSVKGNNHEVFTISGNTTPEVKQSMQYVDDHNNPKSSYFNLSKDDKENDVYFLMNITSKGTLEVERTQSTGSSQVKWYASWESVASATDINDLYIEKTSSTATPKVFSETTTSKTDNNKVYTGAGSEGYYLIARQVATDGDADIKRITYTTQIQTGTTPVEKQVQKTDASGKKLYWHNAEHTAYSTTESSYPVVEQLKDGDGNLLYWESDPGKKGNAVSTPTDYPYLGNSGNIKPYTSGGDDKYLKAPGEIFNADKKTTNYPLWKQVYDDNGNRLYYYDSNKSDQTTTNTGIPVMETQTVNEPVIETVVYTLVVNINGTVTTTKKVGSAAAVSDDTFFKHYPAVTTIYNKTTEKQMADEYATNAPKEVGPLKYGLPMKTKVNDVTTNTEITFTVPAQTSAKLTMVFGDAQRADFKLKNTTTNKEYLFKEDGTKGKREVTILPGNYKITQVTGVNLYYMSLVNVDALNKVSIETTYRAHKNVLDANMKQLLNQLTSELWSGYASKSARKAHFQNIVKGTETRDDRDYLGNEELLETTYNKRYSQLDQGKKNNVTVTKDGTEVWVTFLAEYNMYSCNTLGYYYYTQADYDAKVTNGSMTAEQYAESLDKYIIFPNCSSNQYNSRSTGKYYQYGKFFDESALPLRTGDRVQLVYKGDGSANEVLSGQGYTEKFPEGTIIGWFLLYNSFDGWDDKKDMICDGILRYADDGTTYNNNPDRTSNLDDYKTRVYYSDKEFNTGYSASAAPTRAASNTEIERVVQITEPGGIAICFEDSYDATDGYDDMTYDDLIIAVTASEPLENNSGNTSQVTPTSTEFNEYGTYLFEDILDGNATDFDMNDVVVEYDRTYTITYAMEQTESKYPVTLSKVVEKYTVKNDGATYDDAFVIKTPYKYSQIGSLSYSFKESASATAQTGTWTPTATTRFVQDNSIASVGTRAPKFETDGEYLEIVLFDNINYVTIGSEYEFTITFNDIAAGSSSDRVNWDAREYLHSSYDPFVIVIVDKDNNSEVGDVKRNEMHTPGKLPTTSYGKTEVTNAAMATLTNNYWSVAKVGENYYPFALDLVSVKDFKVCTEFTLFSKAYTKFVDWSTNPNGYTDWYNYTNDGYLATSLPTQR